MYACAASFGMQNRTAKSRRATPLLELGCSSAVDVDDLGGNEAGFVGGQKEHGVGDVLGVSGTFEQLPDFEVAGENVFFGGGGQAFGEHLAGPHAVDANIMRRADARGVTRETFEAGLGCVIR